MINGGCFHTFTTRVDLKNQENIYTGMVESE